MFNMSLSARALALLLTSLGLLQFAVCLPVDKSLVASDASSFGPTEQIDLTPTVHSPGDDRPPNDISQEHYHVDEDAHRSFRDLDIRRMFDFDWDGRGIHKRQENEKYGWDDFLPKWGKAFAGDVAGLYDMMGRLDHYFMPEELQHTEEFKKGRKTRKRGNPFENFFQLMGEGLSDSFDAWKPAARGAFQHLGDDLTWLVTKGPAYIWNDLPYIGQGSDDTPP